MIKKSMKFIAILLSGILIIQLSVGLLGLAVNDEPDIDGILNSILMNDNNGNESSIVITDSNGQAFSEDHKASAGAGFIIRVCFRPLINYEEEAATIKTTLPDGIILDNQSGQSDNGYAGYTAEAEKIQIELRNYVPEEDAAEGAEITDTLQLQAHFSDNIADYVSGGNYTLVFEAFDIQIEIPFEAVEEKEKTDENVDREPEESEETEPTKESSESETSEMQAVSAAAADAEVQAVLDTYGEVLYEEVGTFDRLKTVLLNLDSTAGTITHIRFTDNITAPEAEALAMIGDSGEVAGRRYVKGDFMLDGDSQYTLDMGLGAIRVTNSHSLYVYNLSLKQNSTVNTNQYYRGLFCITGGGSMSADMKWNASFYNLDFSGSALIGAYQMDYYTANRRFDTVSFAGVTSIYVSGYDALNAVIHARNVYISDTFEMTGESTLSSNIDEAMTQFYFLSAGVKGGQSRTYEILDGELYINNTISQGEFHIAEDAVVNITRDPSKALQNPTEAGVGTGLYPSVIFGYEDYEFGARSTFYAKGGTNRYHGYDDLRYTTAVIKSTDAERFYIGEGAAVELETDRATSYGLYGEQYGFTPLYLGKKSHLDFTVAEDAVLDIKSQGVTDGSASSRRGLAPLALLGAGSSTTKIYGTMNIDSQTGNGWYYQYRDAAASTTGKQTFIVEGEHAEVDINASSGAGVNHEYAGFEGYGSYEVEIGVYKGAAMNIYTRGKRAISLAASGSKKIKSITVDGEGSSLTASGIVWGIAAEGQADLFITASNQAIIRLSSDGEVGESYPAGGDAPSTIYGVGRTTIVADHGGEIYLSHRGGSYCAIYQDGGPLKTTVDHNALMKVDSYNSGTVVGDRRAAVTVQSSYEASAIWDTPYDSYINVRNNGTFSVRSHNDEIHSSGAYEQQRYAMGAINFGGYPGLLNDKGGGSIRVSEGGNFYAISDSLSPTIYMNYGTIQFDNPGKFEIRNDSDKDTMPFYKIHLNGRDNPLVPYGQKYYDGHVTYDMANVGQAVYIGPRESTMAKTLQLTDKVVSFLNTDVTVWQIGKNHASYGGGGYADAQIDTFWKNTNITTSIGEVATASNEGRIVTDTTNVLGKWTTTATRSDTDTGYRHTDQFALQAYGRINGSGADSPGGSTNLTLTKEADIEQVELDESFIYTITVGNNWLENVTDSPGGNGQIETNNTVWTNVVLTDVLDYRLDFVECTDTGVTVTTAPGTDEGGNEVTILTITIAEVKASEEFKVNLVVQPNENARSGDILKNQAAVTGLEDIISSNVVEKPEIIGAKGSITVEKYGVEDIPLAGAAFTLERYDDTLHNGEGGWQYIRWDEQLEEWVDDESTGEKYNQATVLNGDETLADTVFGKLETGQYRITEVSSPDNYTTLREPFTGTIPTYDNQGKPVYDIKFAVYNNQVIEMPMAGIRITPKILIAAGFLLSAVMGVLYIMRNKKNI